MTLRICAYCGKPFRVCKRHQSYCSIQCFNSARKKYKHEHYLRNKKRYNAKRSKKLSEQRKEERRQNRLQKEVDKLTRKKKVRELGLAKDQIKAREYMVDNDFSPEKIDSFDVNLEELLIRNNNMISELEEKMLNELEDIGELMKD